MIIEEVKKAISILTNPKANTTQTLSVGDAIRFYYMVAIVPAVITLILGLVLGTVLLTAFAGASPLFGTLGSLGLVLIVVFVLLLFFVIEPIGILIVSAIVHFVDASLLHWYNQPYNNTLTGIVYGVSPIILFYWLNFIPILGGIIYLLLSLWGIYVGSVSIANQQKLDVLKGFFSLLVPGIVIGVVVAVVVAVVFIIFAVAVHGSVVPST